MGYGGACYLVQEVCNALFDALFNILPLGSELDKAVATPSRLNIDWDSEAERALDEMIESQPVLVRISAAKRLRDAAERSARGSGAEVVTVTHLEQARSAVTAGQA